MPGERIERVEVRVFSIPTDAPESDGTLRWDHTTLVLVQAHGAGQGGARATPTRARAAAALRPATLLARCVVGADLLLARRGAPGDGPAAPEPRAAGARVDGALGGGRGALGSQGAGARGVALRAARRGPAAVDVYGSGGFTSYDRRPAPGPARGLGRPGHSAGEDEGGNASPAADPLRVHAAREAIGPGVELFVDANGAYARKQALALGAAFAGEGVTWFEEPVSSEDLDGLALRPGPHARAGMEVAAGEYASDLDSARPLLRAVDVLQADMTRCGGVTGLLSASPRSARRGTCRCRSTARPAQHVGRAVALRPLRHLEYFHDHVRIERMLFDGVAPHVKGVLRPTGQRPGTGSRSRRRTPPGYEVCGPRVAGGRWRCSQHEGPRRSAAPTARSAGGRRRCPSGPEPGGRGGRPRARAHGSGAASRARSGSTPAARALYATDSSNYRQVPLGLVVPRTVDDVVATVAACREFGAPVLSRGGRNQPRRPVLQRRGGDGLLQVPPPASWR